MPRQRWLVVPALMQIALAAVLCFVPLFDLLGYEFSLAHGLLAVPTSLTLGLGVGRTTTRATTAFTRALGLALAHLLPPLALVSLNALRVRNCDFAQGLAFYLLLPVPSALYAAGLGVLIARLLAGLGRGLRVLAAALVAAAPLVHAVYTLYSQPPVFAYDHLWGHFAGSLYDEAVTLTPTLVVFRAGTFLRLALVFGLLVWWDHGRAWRGLLMAVALGGTLGITSLYESTVGTAFGFRVTRDDILRALPVVERRPGIVIHLPPGVPEKVRTAIADEHAFRLAELGARLEVQLPFEVHSFVYANADDKARLMGGRTTMIAKPWLHEIHIHDAVSPHPVLAHELVHVVAAVFAEPPLHVTARSGLWVNLALVEGLAEAVTVDSDLLDLARQSRALSAMQVAPDLRRLMGPAGFWSQAPRRAYAQSGAFVRFLLDTYGPTRLKAAYRHGDFTAAYGQSLDALVSAWEQQVGTVVLSAAEQDIARDMFRTPSIFARPCAHVIAALRRDAVRAAPEQAVAIHEQIVAHLGGSPDARLDLALAMARAGAGEEVLARCDELASDSRLTRVQRSRALELKGDLLWRQGRLDEAKAVFAHLSDTAMSPADQRLQWVKLWALVQSPALAQRLREFLHGDAQPLVAVALLIAESPRHTGDPTPPYLIGRQLHNAKAYAEALTYLRAAAPHPFSPIEIERQRLVADCLWQLGRLEEAAAAYHVVAEASPFSGERARARDWIARLRWQAEHVGAGP